MTTYDDPDFDDEVSEKHSHKGKRVIRFRWPIYQIDPLKAALAEYIETGRFRSFNERHGKKVYLIRAFVRDTEGHEYTTPLPKFLEKYKLIKSRHLSRKSG